MAIKLECIVFVAYLLSALDSVLEADCCEVSPAPCDLFADSGGGFLLSPPFSSESK